MQFPPDIAQRYVLLLDPMLGACFVSPVSETVPHLRAFALCVCALATGGSAIKAVEVLKEHGVPEERIIFINLVCTLNEIPPCSCLDTLRLRP